MAGNCPQRSSAAVKAANQCRTRYETRRDFIVVVARKIFLRLSLALSVRAGGMYRLVGGSVTEHRCGDGKWRPGRLVDCVVCLAKRKPVGVKRLGES